MRNINKFKQLCILMAALFLVSCSAPKVEHYNSSNPEFDFKAFFKYWIQDDGDKMSLYYTEPSLRPVRN